MYSHDDMRKDGAGRPKAEAARPKVNKAARTQEATVDSGAQSKGADEQATVVDERAKRLSELEAQVADLAPKLAQAGEQVAALTGERDIWQSKATAIYDHYLRAKADFEGFRKRTERDFDDRLTRGKGDLLRALLDVMDGFERFLQATEKSGQEGGQKSFEAFFRGVAMIERQLMDALLKEGAEPIESPVGKKLNPEYHEAVAAQDGGGDHGTVVEELERGYVYRGLVLRPAKVKVIR